MLVWTTALTGSEAKVLRFILRREIDHVLWERSSRRASKPAIDAGGCDPIELWRGHESILMASEVNVSMSMRHLIHENGATTACGSSPIGILTSSSGDETLLSQSD